MLTTREVAETLLMQGIKLSSDDVATLARKGVFPSAIKDANGKWLIPREAVDSYLRFRRRSRFARWITVGAIITIIPIILASVSSLKDGLDLLKEYILPASSQQGTGPVSTRSITPKTSAVGKEGGFENDCISATTWFPYAEHEPTYGTPVPVTPIPQTECWFLYDWGIYAQGNELLLIGNDAQKEGLYGISTQITHNTVITFDLELKRLDRDDRVLVGIVSIVSTTQPTDGVFLEAWGGDFYPKYLTLYRLKAGEKESIWISNRLIERTYRVVLQIANARLNAFVDGEKINTTPANVVYPNLGLWIGYQLSIIGGNTEAKISNLSVQRK